MSSNIVNSVAYLRTTRDFPVDNQAMRIELVKSYIDTANAVNSRTIGLFPTNRPAINGEEWFLTGTKQQALRQVFPFTAAGSITHGITTNTFTRIYGAFSDGTNWYPLPYVDVTAADNQVNVYVSPTDIVITRGGGSSPTITIGFVVLEWLANL